LATVLKGPDLREKLSVEAIEPITMTPDEFGVFIKAEIVRWSAIAKARNIQLDN
jgi:tripartite-type tricarboxylate transporter receptor subunit TctC